MNYQDYRTNMPQPRRHYQPGQRRRCPHDGTRCRSRVLVGPAAIATYLFGDQQMANVIKNLAADGHLGHHYRGGVLCSTTIACRLCMERLAAVFTVPEVPNA